MKRLERVDIWVSDRFLEQGLESIFRENRNVKSHLRFVFFTIENYLNVKAQNYNLSTHRLVLLTQGGQFSFLSGSRVYKLDTRITPKEIYSFFIETAWDLDSSNDVSNEKIMLTHRERVILSHMSDGKSVREIAYIVHVHKKTVYQIRRDLIKKLGCASLTGLFRIMRSDVFKRWMINA